MSRISPEIWLRVRSVRVGWAMSVPQDLVYGGCDLCSRWAEGIASEEVAVHDLERQFLHAARLALRLPGERVMRRFEAPLPEDLSKVLQVLQLAVKKA